MKTRITKDDYYNVEYKDGLFDHWRYHKLFATLSQAEEHAKLLSTYKTWEDYTEAITPKKEILGIAYKDGVKL